MAHPKLESFDWKNVANTHKEIANFIFTAKYARYREDLGRRETWEEAVGRVEGMHLNKFSELTQSDLDGITDAFDLVRDRRVGPSMRSMQFGGKAMEAQNLRGYNCSVTHLHSIRSFAEVFFLLLCGCGVGLGLSQKWMSRLPNLTTKAERTGSVVTHVVGDTIEGWADSLEVLMSSYFVGNSYSGHTIEFDYSEIRPEGTPLKTSGGKAPGHVGLKKAHDNIIKLMDAVVTSGATRMATITAYDVMMHTSDAVLSGGIRRSAMSVIFPKSEIEMINAKIGDWITENPQRRLSNNSVLLIRGETTKEEFKEIYNQTKQWGEPGYVWADDEDILYNPCFEIGFKPVTKDGEPGVQVCNLTTINGAKVKTVEDFYEAAEAASVIGTLQAAYTDFNYLSDVSRKLTEEEALIGVSITAMFENPGILLNSEFQREAARRVVETNELWAKILGINPAARATALKPEGSSSLAFGTMFSGIHGAHARVMWRRVQSNRNDNVYRHFKMHNPHLCEDYIYNDTDEVISFPIFIEGDAIFKDDLTAIEHLEYVRSTQENWVLPGTAPHSKVGVNNNVSCTVVVQEDEWDEVAEYIYSNRGLFTAVSLLASTGDKDFPQAPNEAVQTPEDVERFLDMISNFMPVDYTWMQESQDNTSLQQEAACAGPNGSCEITSV